MNTHNAHYAHSEIREIHVIRAINITYFIELNIHKRSNKLILNTELDGEPGTRAFVPINYQLARFGEHDCCGTDVPPNAALATRN